MGKLLASNAAAVGKMLTDNAGTVGKLLSSNASAVRKLQRRCHSWQAGVVGRDEDGGGGRVMMGAG